MAFACSAAISGLRTGGGDINYRLDAERSEDLWRHDVPMDFDSGINFSRGDLICNNTPVADIAPTLAKLAANPNQAEIMDLFTHEQYFWPFYSHYVPTTANGWKPRFGG